ncbi:MAG: ArgE/DapE family deacylase [Gemmatimonadales bacterium]
MPPGDAVALTRALTRIDSRNPTLAPGAPGESVIATALGAELDSWGFEVELHDSAPGRPNLVARAGPADSPALMFAGHLDTVGIEGMTHDPFSADMRDGRIYGRGSADMKAGVAAMCVAAARARDECGAKARRQIIIAAVTDEEYDSLGMRALIASGVRAESAILTEPTRLAICTAHRGFVWIEVDFTGRAAHGSRYDLGIDAIRHAGLLLAELNGLEAGSLRERTHPLLGRGSIHASTISGGIGMSTYPDRCVLRVERRTIPGESPEGALREMNDALDRVRSSDPAVSASVRLMTSQAPSDVASDADVVKALELAAAHEGLVSPVEGLSAWTDAALLNEAGITAVCFGPGDIALAHAAEEFVPVDQIEKATAVLTHVAREWMMERS